MRLYRPINNAEKELIQAANWLTFPPRLIGQPIFYPVLNEAYATEITKDWNVPSYGEGHVVAFEINDDFIALYKIEKVGLDHHLEYWIPAEDLIKFNDAIIGKIELLASYK